MIQIFAKPPVEGKVKTRLIADLGVSVATNIYRYCLDSTLQLVRQSGFDYQVWISEASSDSVFAGESCHLQQGADLGTRMLNAICSQLAQPSAHAPKVVLIGSDCLDMTSSHLQQAFEALCSHDLVLLPALDGGYALIGCRKIEARLFEGVDWGSGRVFKKTLDNARALDYQVELLDPVTDIDTLCDVNRYAELKSLISNA